MATTTTTARTKASGGTHSAAEGASGQRGREWRGYCGSADAPLQVTYLSATSWRPCVTHLSGFSLSATVQTVRVRAGTGTTMFKTRLPIGTNSFEFNFEPPMWGITGLSLVCALTSSAGASEQAIVALGFDEYVL